MCSIYMRRSMSVNEYEGVLGLRLLQLERVDKSTSKVLRLSTAASCPEGITVSILCFCCMLRSGHNHIAMHVGCRIYRSNTILSRRIKLRI